MPENGNNRLDRVERILESLALRQRELAERQNNHEQRQDEIEGDFQRLLTAQVVLTDTVQRVSEHVDRLGERIDSYIVEQQRDREEQRRKWEEHQRVHDEIEERFTVLMRMLDEWIRRKPLP